MSVEKRKEPDTIDVRVPQDDLDFGYLRVNGRSFEDIIHASGAKTNARVPHRVIGGGKGALIDYFVGWAHERGSVPLFICSCGCDGCWSYSVYVRRTRRFVYWEFGSGRGFVFRRKLYEAAFAKAAT